MPEDYKHDWWLQSEECNIMQESKDIASMLYCSSANYATIIVLYGGHLSMIHVMLFCYNVILKLHFKTFTFTD